MTYLCHFSRFLSSACTRELPFFLMFISEVLQVGFLYFRQKKNLYLIFSPKSKPSFFLLSFHFTHSQILAGRKQSHPDGEQHYSMTIDRLDERLFNPLEEPLLLGNCLLRIHL